MFSNYIFFEPDAMGALTLCTIFIYLDAYDFLLRDFSMEIAEVLQKRPLSLFHFLSLWIMDIIIPYYQFVKKC